jgi:hypothetical protein
MGDCGFKGQLGLYFAWALKKKKKPTAECGRNSRMKGLRTLNKTKQKVDNTDLRVLDPSKVTEDQCQYCQLFVLFYCVSPVLSFLTMHGRFVVCRYAQLLWEVDLARHMLHASVFSQARYAIECEL